MKKQDARGLTFGPVRSRRHIRYRISRFVADGRVFMVASGTTGDLLGDSEPNGKLTLRAVKITSGARAGDKVMCFKIVTREVK